MALSVVETDKPETGGIAADRLRSLVDRIERLEEERKALGSDIKDIYAEAKSAGYTPAIIRLLVKERRMDEAERQEREALLETYRAALGGIADLPLGVAAMEAA